MQQKAHGMMVITISAFDKACAFSLSCGPPAVALPCEQHRPPRSVSAQGDVNTTEVQTPSDDEARARLRLDTASSQVPAVLQLDGIMCGIPGLAEVWAKRR